MDRPSERYPQVFEYILSEETDFKTRKIPLASNWDWNMYEHVDKHSMLKNSQFILGSNDQGTNPRPFKNIILPILNVAYRSEGFDVKDIEAYVDDADNYHLSLLVRKYHTKWAQKYSIDTAIDESVESYTDYGLVVVKNVNEERPEVIQLQQIAFCDQTDFLSGPACLKHNFSVDQLLEMKGKWDSDAIDRAVMMSQFNKAVGDREAKTPGKYIEVYELHGNFPDSWLEDENHEDEGKYTPQIHIVTYYVDKNNNKNGIALFKGKEPKPIFKARTRDPIFGRACGRGGIEELFHPQIWTNYSEIQIKEILDQVAAMWWMTNDKAFATRNKTSALKKGAVLDIADGKDVIPKQMNAVNKGAFDQAINAWEQNARIIGSASDPALGLNPVSGTPLGTTEIVTNNGQGIHEYRRGQLAEFWGEIYRDWVLNYLVKEINKGDSWLDELSLEELQEVAEKVSVNLSNQRIKDVILAGKRVTPQEQDLMRSVIKSEFMKGGKKRFIKIMKDEFKDIPLRVSFNIAGKQKDLAGVANKLNSVFRGIFANPQILQAPGMSELFNEILESSGFSPIDFSQLTTPQSPAPQASQPVPTQSPGQGIPSPIQQNQLPVTS